MASAPKRGRRREPLADQVERLGHVVLTWLWTACVWVLRMVFRHTARLAAHAGRWLLRQPRWAQLVLLAGLGAGGVAGYHFLTTRPPPPVYVDDETEALARVIRSEAGVSSMQQRIHVAWVTRNLAAERGQTVAEMACSPCGEQQMGRPVSSRQAATEADRELARWIIASPAMLDPTGGATHFINPMLQDELAASGRPGYRGRPYSDVRQRWMQSYGWEPYYRLGPDLEMWGPKRAVRGRGGKKKK